MKSKTSIIIITISLLIASQNVLMNKVHADDDNHPVIIQNWNWQQDIKTNPNRYWETYHNKPIIQKTNSNNEITYAITALPNNAYYKAWQYAINQYNKLGVIKLVPNTEDKAQIKLMGSYNYNQAENISDREAKTKIIEPEGLTNMSYYDPGNNSNVSYFSKTTCNLSTALGFYQDVTLYKLVALHEIGHALGFNHNNNRINNQLTVMNIGYDFLNASKKQSPKPLGLYEKDMLINHYDEPKK